MASEPAEGKGRWRASRYGWVAGLCVAGFLVTYGVWLAIIVLGEQLQEWGVLGPVFFIALQTLQVILSPIPGEATGFLGGYLFGERLGFVYSTIGLTLGSLAAFGVGRLLGAHYVRRRVRQQTWDTLRFIIEAEGAILCFIVFLIPGFPKDITSYLFCLSPLPLLDLHRRVHAGSPPGHLGALGAGGAHGERELPVGDRPHGHHGGRGPAALLLSDPDRRVVRRLYGAHLADRRAMIGRSAGV